MQHNALTTIEKWQPTLDGRFYFHCSQSYVVALPFQQNISFNIIFTQLIFVFCAWIISFYYFIHFITSIDFHFNLQSFDFLSQLQSYEAVGMEHTGAIKAKNARKESKGADIRQTKFNSFTAARWCKRRENQFCN